MAARVAIRRRGLGRRILRRSRRGGCWRASATRTCGHAPPRVLRRRRRRRSALYGGPPAALTFGRPRPLREYDEKALVEIYRSILARGGGGGGGSSPSPATPPRWSPWRGCPRWRERDRRRIWRESEALSRSFFFLFSSLFPLLISLMQDL